MAEEGLPVDQAILDGLHSRPSAGTAVAVRRDGARAEAERYDYKSQMMQRHGGRSGAQSNFSASVESDVFLEEDRIYNATPTLTMSTSSTTSSPAAAAYSQRFQQEQQQQQRPPEQHQTRALAAVAPSGSSRMEPGINVVVEPIENEDQKQSQASQNKKTCWILSAVAVMVVAAVVIVVVLVTGSSDSGSSNNNNNSAGQNKPTSPQSIPTPAPVSAPGAPANDPTSTAQPTVAVENLDIQVHFESLSFWFVQYGFHYTGCEGYTPPRLTVSAASTAHFIQLQEQSEHRTGNVTCDRIARNKVTCYPQDGSGDDNVFRNSNLNATAEFSTILMFVTASLTSTTSNRIEVRFERAQARNCSLTHLNGGFASGHMCFPQDTTATNELLFVSKHGQCYGSYHRHLTAYGKEIWACEVSNNCLSNCGEILHTTAATMEERVDLPWCHIDRDETQTPPFQWNSQAMWNVVDEYLYIPDFAEALV